jgi:hypothetical protein
MAAQPIDNGERVFAPSFQRSALFRCEIVALINSDDTSAAARDVVENLLRHFETNPESL